MKKHIIFLFLLMFWKNELNAQQDIVDSNIVLLNNLEEKYKSPCLKYEPRKMESKRVRSDKRLIKELNEIYRTELNYVTVISLLEEKGYRKNRRIVNPNWINDTITFEKVNQGYLDSYIRLIYSISDQRLISKRITLITKKHFFCETKEWQSYSYIDFIYLRRLITRIKIPLKIAWSNVELDSK